MKSFLLAIFSFVSLSLFSQNPGVIIDINLLNSPDIPVSGNITFFGEDETADYDIFISEGAFSSFYFDDIIDWETGLVTLDDCDGTILSAEFSQNDSLSNFYYFQFIYCESDSIFGCTDPTALNYSPIANSDDGSCIYEGAENDLCANATELEEGIILIDNSYTPENEGIFGECWNFGSGEGEQSSLWFTFTTPAEPAEIHIEALSDQSWTLTDTQFGLFTECGGEMIYCDGNSGEGLLSAFDFACGELDTNSTYILMVDGWNGDVGTCFLSYEVNDGCNNEVFGCTDPDAINYNPDATADDGSCEYEECENNSVLVVINTENWGNEISWNIRNEDGIEVAGSGGYENYSTMTELACLEDGCYTFELFDSFGDGWNGGAFEILFNNTILASGTLEDGEFGSIPFGVNASGCEEQEIEGCTDPDAINYNPDATIDDGSCEYSCNDVYLGFDFSTYPDDSSYVDMYWVVTNQENGDSLIQYWYNWAPQYELCLETGCYTFEVYNVPPEWDGYYFIFGDVAFAQGEFSGEESTFSITFGVNTEGCDDTEEISGCTDPLALNYNPDATIEDGSCEYEFECGISFDVVADSIGENTYFIIPSENILNAASVLWDFGDGGTSTELFPIHSYEDDGPYTLCLFVSFADSLGNFCEISYCEVLDGSLLGGSGVLSGGFSINIIPLGTLNNDDVFTESELNIFPNPTNDITTISFNNQQNQDLTLRVVNLQGQVVHRRVLSAVSGAQQVQVDLSEFPQGLYLIGLEQNGYSTYTKVIKH